MQVPNGQHPRGGRLARAGFQPQGDPPVVRPAEERVRIGLIGHSAVLILQIRRVEGAELSEPALEISGSLHHVHPGPAPFGVLAILG